MNTVRDLVNAPPSHLFPQSFADAAVDPRRRPAGRGRGARRGGAPRRRLRRHPRRRSGIDRRPRLVRARATRRPDATRHLALVGKGITFDTGGLSLKPAASMVGMKYDMCGAATVLAVARAPRATRRCPCGSPRGCASPTTCRPARATRPATCCGSSTARRSRCSTPMPRAGSCSPTASSRRAGSIRTSSSTSRRSPARSRSRWAPRHAGVMGDDAARRRVPRRRGRDAARLAGSCRCPAHMVDELDSPIADLANAQDRRPGRRIAVRRRSSCGTSSAASATRPMRRASRGCTSTSPGSRTRVARYGFTDKGPTGATFARSSRWPSGFTPVVQSSWRGNLATSGPPRHPWEAAATYAQGVAG